MTKYFILLIFLIAYNAMAEITYMPFLEIPHLDIQINDKDSKQEKIEYSPNSRSLMGLSFLFEKFSIGGSFQLSKDEDNNEVDLDTKYFDFHGVFVNEKYKLGYSYQHYQGFYLADNPYNFSQIERKDIEAINISLFAMISIDVDKINFSEIFKINKIPVHSKGGWLTKIYYNYFDFDSNYSLIEPFSTGSYSSIYGLTHLNQSSLLNLWGYGYLYSTDIYKLYAEILMGLGVQRLRYTKLNKNFENIVTTTSTRVSLLFSTNNLIHNYGVNLLSYKVDSPVQQANISNISSSFTLYYAYTI